MPSTQGVTLVLGLIPAADPSRARAAASRRAVTGGHREQDPRAGDHAGASDSAAPPLCPGLARQQREDRERQEAAAAISR
jgi:hypothetical protein